MKANMLCDDRRIKEKARGIRYKFGDNFGLEILVSENLK